MSLNENMSCSYLMSYTLMRSLITSWVTLISASCSNCIFYHPGMTRPHSEHPALMHPFSFIRTALTVPTINNYGFKISCVDSNTLGTWWQQLILVHFLKTTHHIRWSCWFEPFRSFTLSNERIFNSFIGKKRIIFRE